MLPSYLRTPKTRHKLIAAIDQEIARQEEIARAGIAAAEREKAEAEQRLHGESVERSRKACKRLSEFVRQAWHVLEPVALYKHNWHVDAICDHLEAVTDGRINRLLINVPPGPMRDDSIVETARGQVFLRDVVIGDRVLTHRGRYRAVSAIHRQGTLPILRITTNSGRVTHAAPSHPYLTPDGWVDAKDLQVGDVLAVVNPDEERQAGSEMAPEEARLLGYLVGDGSLTQAMAAFTNADREVIDDFIGCAAALGFACSETRRKGHWHVRIKGGRQVREWLRNHDLEGTSSYTKRIPKRVRDGSRTVMANFIGAYWTCDGGFDVRPTRKRGAKHRAYATTVSEMLAFDLVAGLTLLGIEGRLRRKARKLETAAQIGGIYRSYSIEVQREEMTARFAELPGLCSRKRKAAAACRTEFKRTLWEDTIISIEADAPANCMCLTVEEDHSFTCSGIAVKNSMKSLLVSVFWPAWEWANGHASLRYITTSFAEDATTRDTRKMRDLLTSAWFQARWPEIELTRRGDTSIANTATGFRESSAFSSLTSKRGDRLIIDDPHSTKTAESDVQRADTVRLFREGAINRLNDQERSAIVIVMQRLHEQDLSGTIISFKMGYVHLCLPMEFEEDRRCSTAIGFMDPRQHNGDLLDLTRFPSHVVDDLKRDMGSFAFAGQYQQRPAPREGGMFKRKWFADRFIKAAPADTIWVRHWDLAATKRKDAARTAGVKIGRQSNGRFVVGHVVTTQDEGHAVRQLISATAATDGKRVSISLPQDPGQAGKSQAADMIAMLAGYVVHAEPETGDKAVRAEPFAVQCEAGNVDIVEGEWNELYLDELCNFPTGRYKDQTDASSGAFAQLAKAKGPLRISDAALRASSHPTRR